MEARTYLPAVDFIRVRRDPPIRDEKERERERITSSIPRFR